MGMAPMGYRVCVAVVLPFQGARENQSFAPLGLIRFHSAGRQQNSVSHVHT
jgi:hypothetical protein